MRTIHTIGRHCLCLLPLAVLLCVIRLYIGPEEAVFAFFAAWRKSDLQLTQWVLLFTNLGNTLLYGIYIAIFVRAVRQGRRRDILFTLSFVLAQILVAALLSRLIKVAVGRPRPMTGGHFMPFSFGGGYQSFPSGHTVEAVSLCTPLAVYYTKILLPLALGVYIAFMGLSRLYLGMHYPSDLWGGMALGSLGAYLTMLFVRIAEARWKRPDPNSATIPASRRRIL